jgi:hypothetical protein
MRLMSVGLGQATLQIRTDFGLSVSARTSGTGALFPTRSHACDESSSVFFEHTSAKFVWISGGTDAYEYLKVKSPRSSY